MHRRGYLAATELRYLLLFQPPPDYISAGLQGEVPLANNCEPPFGFCHEHTVGMGFDKPENFDVPGSAHQTVSFYRCGAYREPCDEVCSNAEYANREMVNSGQERDGDFCTGLDVQDFLDIALYKQALHLRRWQYSDDAGVPL